jgi:acyl carrier protein
MNKTILELIYRAIDDVNSGRTPEDHLSKTEDAVILGRGSKLDSLGLVNFIVSLEQAINDEMNVELVLADERAMMMESSPFRTVRTLATFIETLMTEAHRVSD